MPFNFPSIFGSVGQIVNEFDLTNITLEDINSSAVGVDAWVGYRDDGSFTWSTTNQGNTTVADEWADEHPIDSSITKDYEIKLTINSGTSPNQPVSSSVDTWFSFENNPFIGWGWVASDGTDYPNSVSATATVTVRHKATHVIVAQHELTVNIETSSA